MTQSSVLSPQSYELTLSTFPVSEVAFGRRTRLEGQTLTIDREDLLDRLRPLGPFRQISVELARPGESLRIVHALDVVEPRTKVEGPGSVFPGFLGPTSPVGRGRTNRLAGVAVVETSELGLFNRGMGVTDSIIEMSGPGARYVPFSQTLNVVVDAVFPDEVPLAERDNAVRLAGLTTASYLAAVTREATPADQQTLALPAVDPALPRVVHICQAISNDRLHELFFYGQSVSTLLPVLAHPNELADGAVVSANAHFPCQRNPTYVHQNNPVVRELLRLHGREVAFAGVILAPSHSPFAHEKERRAGQVAKLAYMLGARGAVFTQESGGHGAVDLMMTCQQCERLGIKTVLSLNEIADPNTVDFALPDAVPEADAIVSTGNREEIVQLPPVEAVLGGRRLMDGTRDAGGSLTVPVRLLYGSTNQMGFFNLRAHEV